VTTSPHWRSNLVVCVVGSFSTIVAMTMLLPYLPLYVEHLGVHGHAAIERWSGIAYAATFLTAALTAPIWGRLGDRYGRKPMLMRASLGMAIAMSLIGLAQNVEQLVLLRLLTGLLGGYSSGSMIIIAAQTPRERCAWALGVLSTGVMAGTVVGPLVGGVAPDLVGVRTSFLVAGGIIFLAFLATTFGLREERPSGTQASRAAATAGLRGGLPGGRRVGILLVTACLLMLATLSIEPIVTVYIGQLDPGTGHVAALAGVVMAIGAAGSIASAPRVGRLADRLGYERVITACLSVAALMLALQALVENVWELGFLRLAMGVALGGLLPTITASIRHTVPDGVVGRVLGLSVSAQYVGQVIGPLLGGVVAGVLGIRAVFAATAIILAVGASLSRVGVRSSRPDAHRSIRPAGAVHNR
jgi:MFS family permease